MTDVQLPVRSINSALRASHERLTSDVLVAGDPDYPFPEEDYLGFVLIRLDNSWKRERERASWTVPEGNEHIGVEGSDAELPDPPTEYQAELGAWSA